MNVINLSKWLILALLVCPVFGEECLPVRDVPITILFEFGKLKPKPDDGFYRTKRRYIDTDNMRCVYVLDKSNHRILKYSEDGKFLNQIGSIGQNASDLYYPSAIRISGDSIYIVDQNGVWIKKYSQDGRFISRIESGKKRELIDCIDLDQDHIFCDLRKISRNFNQYKLLTVFDSKGKTVAQFGDIVKCHNIYAYLIFNSSFFSIVDENLTGALATVPIIFKYKTNGTKVYQKDLRNMNLEIIRLLSEKTAKEKNNPYDTPEHMISPEGGVHSFNYCKGFDVDENSDIYFAAWGFDFPPVVYRFDPKGIPQEVIKLKIDGKDVAALGIFINRSLKIKYGVGFIWEGISAVKPFFFKF